ncbi:hemerythrin-like metal-binding domain protein [Marinobacter daqiaonensis]|uniref:Hemerythrin-like metal-binding domain protein n=1 Tax=Marinobacter daqiaonensis TaxID=650891 RepID=A0A1I6HRL5_9GAMM|nr:bacteriohemerythrin [Marinobacter daqiaonensis]SFR57018.1 hemerythrin-like metal-binding domain protein [Marinobacter daqiaonensis]
MSGPHSSQPDFELFPWNSQFETGIEQIDVQHQKLVEILNRLAWHLSAEDDELQAGEILQELLDYASYHFRSEEAIWKQFFAGSSIEANHHKGHEHFFEQIRHYEARRQQGDTHTLPDMFDFLTRWLAFHILESDRRMAMMTFSIRTGHSIEEAADEADKTLSGGSAVMVQAILEIYGKLSNSAVQLMKERAARRAAEEELRQLKAARDGDNTKG